MNYRAVGIFMFDLQTVVILVSKSGPKAEKLVGNNVGIVNSYDLRCDMLHVHIF